MFIEPLHCPKCQRLGRPGEVDFPAVGEGDVVTVYCSCGELIRVANPRDQFILSGNIHCCLLATSNYFEHGQISLIPGSQAKIRFSRPIDSISNISFSPGGPIALKELFVEPGEMSVLSSSWIDKTGVPGPVQVDWSVEGLVDIDALPMWYVLFYSAVGLAIKKLYKPALLDYAVSFEAFVGEFLSRHLERLHGAAMAQYLLKRAWRVEERSKDLLALVTGKRLTDRLDVYQDWDKNVRRPRDLLMHGKPFPVDETGALRARQAVHQAIRWIQGLAGEPHPLGSFKWKGQAGSYRVAPGSTSVTIKLPKPMDQLGG